MQVSGVSDGVALLRGSAVGAVSAALAVAAHATAGGMLPGTSALLLLVGLGAALGAGAATVAWLRDARLALLGLLGAGQLAGHLLLGVGAMGDHPAPSMPMLAVHAGAVAVAAVLISLAERVGPAWSAALARVLPAVPTPLVVRPHTVAPPPCARTSAARSLMFTTSLARRGPPVGA